MTDLARLRELLERFNAERKDCSVTALQHDIELFRTLRNAAPALLTAAEDNERMRARIEKLGNALHMIRHMWAGHAESCHFVTSRYKGECDCDWPKIEAQCDSALSQDDK